MDNFLKFDNKNFTLLTKKRNKSMEDLVNNTIKKKAKNNLDAQFDLMTTSGPKEPVPINKPVDDFNFNLRRDLEFQNNYSSFQNNDMHYGVVSKEDFIHDNMVPNTSKRDFEVNNGYFQDRKLQAMSGNDDYWKHKKEVENFFDVAKDITYVNGAPVFTSEFEGRYLPDEKLNFQDLPFANKIKVRPGINGEVQPARNEVYRILPKNVDELRPLGNQKVSFQAKKVEAVKKGEMRAPDFNITKVKKFGEIVGRETQPNKADVSREAVRPKFKKPSGNRDMHNKYKGPAYQNQGDGPSTSKTKHQKSKKVTFDNDPQRNVSNIRNKPVMTNTKSFTNYETDRASTSHNITGNLTNNNKGNWIKNLGDIAKSTIKETTIHNKYEGNIANDVKEGFIRMTENIAKPTIKETTELQQFGGNIQNEIKEGFVRMMENIAKPTIKETTELQQFGGNLQNEIKEGFVRMHSNIAKNTIKETTELQQFGGNIQNKVSSGFIRMLNDKAKSTIKESTEFQQHGGNIQNRVTDGYARDLNDKARSTIKESTEFQKHEGNIQNRVSDGYARDLNDKARSTIKESTEFQKHEGNIQNRVTDGVVKMKDDIAKPTIKQSTLFSSRGNNYNGDNSTYVRDKELNAKATVKQTTLHSTRGNNYDGNNSTYVRDKELNAKPTVKQTTLHSTRGNNYDGNNSSYVRDLKDKAKTTIKETTHLKDYTGTLRTEVENQRTRDDIDNMETDERREILNYNRTPGGKSDGTYVLNEKGFKLRKPIHFAHYNHGSIPVNNIDDNNNQFSRNRPKTSYIESDYKVNYDFIRTLKNNPLVNDILHPKGV
jgi:hypothetical protein